MAFVYIMDESRPLGIPTRSYVETCRIGYHDFGFDEKVLQKALHDSMEAKNEDWENNHKNLPHLRQQLHRPSGTFQNRRWNADLSELLSEFYDKDCGTREVLESIGVVVEKRGKSLIPFTSIPTYSKNRHCRLPWSSAMPSFYFSSSQAINCSVVMAPELRRFCFSFTFLRKHW